MKVVVLCNASGARLREEATFHFKPIVEIAYPPAPSVGVHRYVPSTARARSELGLHAEVPLREAIRRTHAWFSAEAARESTLSQQAATARGQHA